MPIVGEFLRQALDSLFSGGPAYIAVTLAVALGLLLGRTYLGRKRLSFEEDFNSKIGIVPFARQDDPAAEILTVFNSVSVVVLRVWNSGRVTIDPDDYVRPLRFVVRGRRYIVDFRLSEPEPDTLRGQVEREARVSALVDPRDAPPPARARQALVADLPDSLLSPTREQREQSRELALPRMQLRRGAEFRLVVCLREDELAPRDSETDKGYEFGGTLKPGKIIDQGAPKARFSATRALTAAVLVLAVLLVGAIAWRFDAPSYCADGELRVAGSSAFEPAVRTLSQQYVTACGAEFDLAMDGSLEGVRALQGAEDPEMIAFSDGLAQDAGPELEARPVAVLVFALVVNADAGVQDLTTDQIRAIYRGEVRSWAEVGGADLPIRLVSRNADSGSRRAFEGTVLAGRELSVTSDDCLAADPGTAPIRCERGSTSEVLDQVADTSGAIGYADATPAAAFPSLRRVRIDGLEPTDEYLAAGYPFWTIEYAYTRGFPPAGSLRSRFVDYLSDDEAALDLQAAGYTPCVDSDGVVTPICATGN